MSTIEQNDIVEYSNAIDVKTLQTDPDMDFAHVQSAMSPQTVEVTDNDPTMTERLAQNPELDGISYDEDNEKFLYLDEEYSARSLEPNNDLLQTLVDWKNSIDLYPQYFKWGNYQFLNSKNIVTYKENWDWHQTYPKKRFWYQDFMNNYDTLQKNLKRNKNPTDPDIDSFLYTFENIAWNNYGSTFKNIFNFINLTPSDPNDKNNTPIKPDGVTMGDDTWISNLVTDQNFGSFAQQVWLLIKIQQKYPLGQRNYKRLNVDNERRDPNIQMDTAWLNITRIASRFFNLYQIKYVSDDFSRITLTDWTKRTADTFKTQEPQTD